MGERLRVAETRAKADMGPQTEFPGHLTRRAFGQRRPRALLGDRPNRIVQRFLSAGRRDDYKWEDEGLSAMKLILDHLGRIGHAEIDMRPLTVLVGKNGTNKTWTAHSYFKILERLRVVDRPSPPSPTLINALIEAEDSSRAR